MSLFYIKITQKNTPHVWSFRVGVNRIVTVIQQYLAMTNTMLKPFSSAIVLILCALLIVSGCANMPDPADREAVADYMQVNDPLEPTNRNVFSINQGIDKGLLKPAAEFYRDMVPATARLGISNALNNLRTPVILLNNLLQGDLDRSVATLARFLVNSTVGMLGIADVAAELGVPPHSEDFGQTLAVWGIPSGPYLMLPIFGPSNPRDTVGLVVDVLTDPLNMWMSNTDRTELALSRAGVNVISQRELNLELLNEVEKSSLDFYAAIRSLYRQRRAHEISNGVVLDQADVDENIDFPKVSDIDG